MQVLFSFIIYVWDKLDPFVFNMVLSVLVKSTSKLYTVAHFSL